MAIQFAESFDIYGVNESFMSFWNFDAGNAELSTAISARTGTYSFRIIPNAFLQGALIRRAFPTPVLSGGAAFGYYAVSGLPGNDNIHKIRLVNAANNNIIMYIAVEANGSISIRNSGGSVLAQSGPVITANSWYHIELKFNVDDIIGSCEVRVNGETVVQITNTNFGLVPVGNITFNNLTLGGNFFYHIDDLIVWDTTDARNNDFIGQARVLTVFPAGDTAQADFTVTGAASGYQAIDEVPPDNDTSYIEGVNANDISEFSMPSLPPEVVSIVGLFVPSRSKLSAAGAATLQISMVSNGQVALGVDRGLGVGWTYFTDIYETNPDGGGAWSKAAFEAALIRLEKTS